MSIKDLTDDEYQKVIEMFESSIPVDCSKEFKYLVITQLKLERSESLLKEALTGVKLNA